MEVTRDHHLTKKSVSQEFIPSVAAQSGKFSRDDGHLSRPCQVFRNKTTAIEVIVKEVTNKSKTRTDTSDGQEMKIQKLQEDIHSVRGELTSVQTRVASNNLVYETIIRELKKQLDAAARREPELLARSATLQLENEKLKTMLELRTNLVRKLKKELLTLKKTVKFVIKAINRAAPTMGVTSFVSDVESDLDKQLLASKQSDSLNNTGATLNSFRSKESAPNSPILRT